MNSEVLSLWLFNLYVDEVKKKFKVELAKEDDMLVKNGGYPTFYMQMIWLCSESERS